MEKEKEIEECIIESPRIEVYVECEVPFMR